MTLLARIVTGRPRATLATILALSVLLATGLGHQKTRAVLEGELPPSDRIVREHDLFTKRHPNRNFSLLGVVAEGDRGIWNATTLGKIAALSAEAARLPQVLPDVQSLATWKEVAATEDGVRVRPLMPEPPLDAASVEDLRARARADRLVHGRLVSDDGRMALVRIAFSEEASQASVHAALEGLRARFEGPERIVVIGRHHLNQEIENGVQQQLQLMLPAALVLLLAFLHLCFGRWQAVWIPATLIGLTAVDYLGAIGLLGISQSVLSGAVPILLLVALSSYVVHLLWRTYEEAERRPWHDAVHEAVLRTGPGIALAAGTAAAGFMTLLVFEIYSVREFGALAATGVLVAGALTLTWTPACLLVSARRPSREHVGGRRVFLAGVDRIARAAAAGARPGRAWTQWGFAALLLAALGGAAQLRVGSKPSDFFPPEHPVPAAYAALRAHFGADGFMSLEVEAPAGSDVYDPAFLKRVGGVQVAANAMDDVGYTASVLDTVLTRANREMNGGDPARERIPETRALAAQYLEFYRWGAADALAEMVEDVDPPRRLVVDVFTDVRDSQTVASTLARLRAALGRHFPESAMGRGIFGGEWLLWISQNSYIVRGKILNLLLSIALVAIVCVPVLGSVRWAIIAVIPAACAAVLVFGVMGATGIRLDLASCVITAMVVGIGVDFAVHLILRYREVMLAAGPRSDRTTLLVEAIHRAAPPILYDALSNVVAFSVLVASPLLPVRHLGALLCLSLGACAAATLGLLPRRLGTAVGTSPPRPRPLPTEATLEAADRVGR